MLQHIKCPCGCYLMESSIKKHLQTKKHWKGIIDTRSRLEQRKADISEQMSLLFEKADEMPSGEFLKESNRLKELFDKVNCDDKPKAPFYGTYRTSAIVKVPLYGIEILVKVNHENWEFILETLE